MKNLTLRNLVCGVAAASACVVFTGCAGGGTSNPVTNAAITRSAGQASITIYWPPRTNTSRLVPAAANSVVVQFIASDGKTVVAAQTLVRPSNNPSPGSGGTAIPSTASFVDIPQGTYTVAATAYPSTDGSGIAQATATGPITISADASTPIGLTMATTIKTIDITPHNVVLNGTPVTLTATAYDGSGNVVLTTAWSWTDTNPGVISINASGVTAVVNAVGTGTATITATETDSGASGSTNFTVGGG